MASFDLLRSIHWRFVLTQIIVRDAAKDDAQVIAALLDELGYPATSDFALAKIKTIGGRKNDRILVAEQEGEVVAVLSLHIMPLLHMEQHLCRVSALVVKDSHRRQYIGQRLMEMAESYAKANNCFRIEITSGDQRADAHSFYTMIGYNERSKRFCKDI